MNFFNNGLSQPTKMASLFDGREKTIYDKAEENQKEDKLLRVVNDNPLQFQTTVEKCLTTTTEMAMQINEIFKPIFSDWYGCEVVPNVNGGIEVKFIFKAINNGDKETRAFLPINQSQEKTDNQVLDRIYAINAANMSKNHTLEITSYGAEVIYDVMINEFKKKINPHKKETMRKYYSETSETVGYAGNVQNIYCTVIGIDIYKVLGVVFGNKSENGDQIVYKATPIRPVTPGLNPMGLAIANQNYVVDIEKMEMKKFNSAMLKIGMMPMSGAIAAVTSTVTDTKK